MDAPTFRTTFPEFTDNTKYPDTAINFWLNLGTNQLPCDRWGALLDFGLALYIAHQLTVATGNQNVTAVGGAPGQINGPVSSKSVDKVSVARDATRVTLDDGGFWNLTSYGVQFLQTAMMVGAGGLQL